MTLCNCGCGQRTNLAPWSDRNKGWVKGEPLKFIRGHSMRGRTLTQEQRERQIGKTEGEINGRWLGDAVGYAAVHVWLQRHKKRTGICELCEAEPKSFRGKRVGTEFANLSGEYKRDPDDYIEVCRKCHRWLDKST